MPSFPDLTDRSLLRFLAALALLVAVSFAARAILPGEVVRPGSPLLYALAVVGSLLMLATLLFPATRRSGRGAGRERAAHHLHMLAGSTGAALVFVHASGFFGKAPALLVLAAIGIVATGLYGRVLAGRLRYLDFAADARAFALVAPGQDDTALHRIADAKRAALLRLAPKASEAAFSVSWRDWLGQPLLAARYWRLALAEARLVTQRRARPASAVYRLQRIWRLLHLTLVVLLLAGLAAHVVAVTFFAGYAAQGGDPYWWHVRR